MKLLIDQNKYRDLLYIVSQIMEDARDNYSNCTVPLEELSHFDGAFTTWADEILQSLGLDIDI